jgi:hypothetical protein
MNCCVRRKRFHRDCVLPTPTGCRFSHILRQFLSFTLVEHSAVRTRVGRCLIYPDGPANMVTDSGFNVFRFPTLTATSLGAPFFNDKVGQTTITSAMQRIVAQYVRFAPGHTVAYAAASFAANTGTATLTSQYPIASTVPFLMATNGVCWVDNPQNVPIGASNFAIVGFANATAVRLVRSAVTGRVECPVALVQLTRPAPGPTTRPPTPAPTTRAHRNRRRCRRRSRRRCRWAPRLRQRRCRRQRRQLQHQHRFRHRCRRQRRRQQQQRRR